jgi:hypothetical protein
MSISSSAHPLARQTAYTPLPPPASSSRRRRPPAASTPQGTQHCRSTPSSACAARTALGAWSACMKMSVACARCASLPKEPLAHASVVRVGCALSSGAKRAALHRSCSGAHAALDMRNGPENAPERRSRKASPVVVKLQRSPSSETRHCARSTASTARSTRSPQPRLSQSSAMVAGSCSGSRMSMATVKGGSTCCESHARHITVWSSIFSLDTRRLGEHYVFSMF